MPKTAGRVVHTHTDAHTQAHTQAHTHTDTRAHTHTFPPCTLIFVYVSRTNMNMMILPAIRAVWLYFVLLYDVII